VKTPAASVVSGQVIHRSLTGHFKHKSDPLMTFQEYWTTIKGIPLDHSDRESSA
jgi:hypothetical protein